MVLRTHFQRDHVSCDLCKYARQLLPIRFTVTCVGEKKSFTKTALLFSALVPLTKKTLVVQRMVTSNI